MWKFIVAVALLTIVVISFNAPHAKAEGEWSVGVGAQFVHTRGLALDLQYTRPFTEESSFRWYSKLASFDGQAAVSFGIQHDWTKRFYSGFGVGFTQGNDIIDTAWHYESPIIGWRITPTMAIEGSHRSNCSKAWKFTGDKCLWVLPRGTTPNLGYNFLALRWRF